MEQESLLFNKEMESMKSDWIQEQCEIQKKIVELDISPRLKESDWRYIGGLDISFIVGDDINAAACYVVLDKDLQVAYKDVVMVQMTAPYIPGFLAFREASFLIDLVIKQRYLLILLLILIKMQDLYINLNKARSSFFHT